MRGRYKKQTKIRVALWGVQPCDVLELEGLLTYSTDTPNKPLKYKQLLELPFCKQTVNIIFPFSQALHSNILLENVRSSKSGH